MTESDIAVKLDQLAGLQAERQNAADAIMAEPWASGVANEYAKLQLRITEETTVLSASIADVETEVRMAMFELGSPATVKGEHLMAVFTRGRVTWDGKVLEGYVIAHPELAAARRVGQPGVAIRAVQNA